MNWRKARHLKDCLNIDDLRDVAARRLPYPVFHYLDGGAEDEWTLRENNDCFERERLIPRCLVDVTHLKTSVHVLGQDIEWPVFCSPTGGTRFFHADGELAVARAAAKAGTYYGLSTLATHSLEDVARSSTGPKMYQLYICKNRDITRDMIHRCKQAGYKALCLTVDGAVPGNRERDRRSGWGLKIQLSARSAIDFALHPRWVAGLLAKGSLSMPNIASQIGSQNIAAQMKFFGEQLDPSVSWKDLREFIELWNGPFAVKGVMAVADARRAAEIGATAVILSNHGGRQLDGAASPLEVLPEVASAVGDQLDVILDSGIRRGSQVLKALARGAKACSIGRAYLYGLSAGGELGVTRALDILRSEFERAMRLAGCADVREVNSDLLSPR
jgi:L-lactate dehydrogenase (cytochrome)